MGRHIVRLDDACPTMSRQRWDAMERVLDRFQIKPIVAVIPDNHDSSLMIDKPNDMFWEKVRAWQEKGWMIGLHGYSHCCQKAEPGLVPIHLRSEFTGNPLEDQKNIIKKGLDIFSEQGIRTNIWVAPAHSFDLNTLQALTQTSEIKFISDGLALCPYNEHGFVWVPQQLTRPVRKTFGIWTCCFHPNTMNDSGFQRFERFCQKNNDVFINSLEDLPSKYCHRRRSLWDDLYEYYYLRRLSAVRQKDRLN